MSIWRFVALKISFSCNQLQGSVVRSFMLRCNIVALISVMNSLAHSNSWLKDKEEGNYLFHH